MKSLLLVIPYHQNDAAQAKRLLEWISELHPEGYQHPCLLACDASVDRSTQSEIFSLAKSTFSSVDLLRIPVPMDRQGWIPAANLMFEKVSQTIHECMKMPWLWCEPDCVPLHEAWLDALTTFYHLQPRRFMGAWVTQDGQMGMPSTHLAGCSIYDSMAFLGLKQFTASSTVAWDIGSAAYSVMRSTNTPLIQHFWGKPELAPTFRETKSEGDPENTIPMGYLQPNAVLWHRCKDGTLIDLLRARKELNPPQRKRGRKPTAISTPPLPAPIVAHLS